LHNGRDYAVTIEWDETEEPYGSKPKRYPPTIRWVDMTHYPDDGCEMVPLVWKDMDSQPPTAERIEQELLKAAYAMYPLPE
jgi:hypothetical protein